MCFCVCISIETVILLLFFSTYFVIFQLLKFYSGTVSEIKSQTFVNVYTKAALIYVYNCI
jgi:hypothetical protein